MQRMKVCNFSKFCRSIGVKKKYKKSGVVQISETLNKYCNLKTFKMGKTWHFILCYIRHTKTNVLAIARTQKKIFSFKSNKNKTKNI
jgi:hypothetical protein